MGLPLRKNDQHYTYKDYRQWPEDERWELIQGVAYSMGAPTLSHQGVSATLMAEIYLHLKGKPCQVFAAPTDVLFPLLKEQEEDEVDTVVQPDILVVCDPDKLRTKGIWGAPDLVVEILSPSTSRKDLREKFDLYQRAGVREYWVIEPAGRWMQQYSMGPDGQYAPEVTLIEKGRLTSTVLPEFSLEVSDLWRGSSLPV